jgi:hypothetical protein
MANTYVLIEAINLTGTSTGVTFSSIPQTYTDLVLKCSVRIDQVATRTNIRMSFNGTPTLTEAQMVGYASTVGTGTATGNTFAYWEYINGNSATTSTFGYGEMYLANYASTTQYKVANFQSASESNSNTTTGQYIKRIYIPSTTAISSISLAPASGNMLSGCSFYLYGIKNS